MARPSEYCKDKAAESVGAVYALVDPTTNEARYVGWSKSPSKRLAQHCRASTLRRDASYKGRWVAGLMERGVKPELIVLEDGPDDWREAEQFWIAYLRSLGARLTNIQPGGEISPRAVAKTSSRSNKGFRWGELQRRRQVLRHYPEKLTRVEAAIRSMAKRIGVSQREAEEIIERRLAQRSSAAFATASKV